MTQPTQEAFEFFLQLILFVILPLIGILKWMCDGCPDYGDY